MSQVQNILTEPDGEKRDASYAKLYARLHASSEVEALDLEETISVLSFLLSHPLSVRERAWLWKLLIFGTDAPRIRGYALACVEEEDTYIRGLAFVYLQKHAPEIVPELVARFAHDRSPHVRYGIASTILDTARRRTMLEAILPDCGYDHELYDGIELELYEMDHPR
jgi:hypothetical protein